MKKGESVSVVIPTFNRPLFLKQAVASVIDQTHPVQEIIVVNNGSDSGCRPTFKNIEKMSGPVSVVHLEENHGASTARNIGKNRSRGDYLIFLDDDDLLHPAAVENGLAEFNRAKGTDVVVGICAYFSDNEHKEFRKKRNPAKALVKKQGKPVFHCCGPEIEKAPFYSILVYGLPLGSLIMRRETAVKARFDENLSVGEDTVFLLRIANYGASFKFLDRVMLYYRQHGSNSGKKEAYYQLKTRYLLALAKRDIVPDGTARSAVNAKLALYFFLSGDGKWRKYFVKSISRPKDFFALLTAYLKITYRNRLCYLFSK